MSIVATHWAWGQLLPPTPKLILMSLADNADEAGYCWPRIRKVAERCSVSERTVQRTLKNFEALGLLRVTRRFRPEDGRQLSNGYQLCLVAYPDNVSPSPSPRRPAHDVSDTRGVSLPRQGGGVGVVTPLEPPKQPSSLPPPQLDNEDARLVLPTLLDPVQSSAMRALLESCGPELGQAVADEVQGIAATGKLRSCPLRLAESLRERALAGTFSPRLGVTVAAQRTTAQKRRLDDEERARAKAARLAEGSDPILRGRLEAARIKAVEELKKRGFVA